MAAAALAVSHARQFGRYALLLWIWVAAVVWAGAASLAHPISCDSGIVAASLIARGLGFTGVMSALNLAAIESWVAAAGASVIVAAGTLGLVVRSVCCDERADDVGDAAGVRVVRAPAVSVCRIWRK